MKKLLLAGIAVAALSGAPALAADLPTKAPVYKAVAPMFDWSGFYVGGHVGYGWGSVEWTDNVVGVASIRPSNDVDGWLGGGHIGWQRQWGQYVGGVELSWSGGDLNSNRDEAVFLAATRTFEARVDSLVLAVVRLGIANNQWLWYAKGGFATAEVDTLERDLTGGFGPGVIISAGNKRQYGWTIGAGVEYALTSNWIVGLEYNFVDLGSKDVNNTQVAAAGVTNHEDRDPRFSTVMARVSYKFGDWGKAPVSAKY